MSQTNVDLVALARQQMIDEGFDPDFPPETRAQIASIEQQPATPTGPEVHDLRQLLWSSIDNDTSRDLDQAEVAERVAGGIRVRVAIADVDADVKMGTPIDRHASSQTTSVYTHVGTFPMLPEELSTGLTSLNENGDRQAIVIEFVAGADGAMSQPAIYRALVRNRAQLTYNAVGAWLEGKTAAPPKLAQSADLQAQLKMQDEAAQALRAARFRLGALNFDRVEAEPVFSNGHVESIEARQKNRATELIEDFMVAANEVMARTLAAAGMASIRRVVKTPKRWPRIVELAEQSGDHLPAEPDSKALNEFLESRRAKDPVHYPDVSLAVVKLMGPGEYVMARAGQEAEGHFGLAAHDYTHSTAPNRRFADLVTQRLVKALIEKAKPPYSEGDLDSIARNCTLKEDAARKVERAMDKRIAAMALAKRVGQSFQAVVTGVTPHGVYVRVLHPPVEGRLMHGEHGLDVGDSITAKLVGADPQRGFIDFVRV